MMTPFQGCITRVRRFNLHENIGDYSCIMTITDAKELDHNNGSWCKNECSVPEKERCKMPQKEAFAWFLNPTMNTPSLPLGSS